MLEIIEFLCSSAAIVKQLFVSHANLFYCVKDFAGFVGMGNLFNFILRRLKSQILNESSASATTKTSIH